MDKGESQSGCSTLTPQANPNTSSNPLKPNEPTHPALPGGAGGGWSRSGFQKRRRILQGETAERIVVRYRTCCWQRDLQREREIPPWGVGARKESEQSTKEEPKLRRTSEWGISRKEGRERSKFCAHVSEPQIFITSLEVPNLRRITWRLIFFLRQNLC